MSLLNNQRMADSVTGIYQNLEELLMQNIIRHIKDYDKPIDSDDWQLQKLAEIGKLNKENIQIIAQQAGISQTAAEGLLNKAAQEAIKQLEPCLQNAAKDSLLHTAVPVEKSKNIKQTVEALQTQAKDSLNLCNTNMLYKARDTYKSLVQNICSTAKEIEQKQDFLDLLNKKAVNVSVGAESRTKAVRECIKQFNEKGIPAFVDKAGREWTPEAYVNMCMRNTAKNVADEVQSERCKEYGCNLIEISSHSGARPKCAKDQGKIFDLNNESGFTEDATGKKIRYYPWKSSSYGEPDGILGINCGHHKYPFIPGVNIQTYFPIDEEENDKLYEQTQVQRALERDVRKQKRECMLYDELGDTEAFEKSAVKLKAKEAKLKNYVDSNDNLHRKKDREQVVGFDKSISSKAVSANKKNALKNTKKSVANSSESGIIKSKKSTKNKSKSNIVNRPTKKKVVDYSKTGSNVFSQNSKTELYQNERIISGDKRESAILYNSQGERIFVKKGKKDSVTFTKDEIAKMKNGVLTHNHPNGTVFSPDDINMLRRGQLSEIRACNSLGTYVLRNASEWDDNISDFEKISNEYWSIMNEVGKKYSELSAKEGKPIFYYMRQMDEEGLKVFSEKYGLEFVWEEKK